MPGLCNRRSGRRGRPAWPFLVVLMAAVVLQAAACSSPGATAPTGPATAAASAGPVKAVIPPDTPAGTQLRWLIAAMAHLPLSGAQVRAHFDGAFLAQVSSAMLNQALQSVVSVKLLSIQVSEPSTLVAIVSTSGVLPRAQAALTVDSQGLISGLRISPATTTPTPTTWPASTPPSARSPPRSAYSSPTSPVAHVSRYTASTRPPRRRSARPSSSTCSTRWAVPWPQARSTGTSR